MTVKEINKQVNIATSRIIEEVIMKRLEISYVTTPDRLKVTIRKEIKDIIEDGMYTVDAS